MSYIELMTGENNPLGGNIIQTNNSVVEAALTDWHGAVDRTSWYARGENITINGHIYAMDFSVHQRDYYKWVEGDKRSFGGLVFGDMAQLHLFGVAQDFEQYGSFTTTVTWKHGQRQNNGATLTDAP
jgi:hypothetical protein